MPESKKRKKVIEQRKADAQYKPRHSAAEKQLRSPKWWAPLMVGLMILGLIIVVMAYVTAQSTLQLPIPNGGNWNLFLGMALMIAGFLMTMGWK